MYLDIDTYRYRYRCIKVNDSLNGQYSVDKNLWFKTLMSRSILCDYSHVYIVVKGKTIVASTNANNITNKMLVFKNNAPYRSCISNINKPFIDKAEDLDLSMLM